MPSKKLMLSGADSLGLAAQPTPAAMFGVMHGAQARLLTAIHGLHSRLAILWNVPVEE